MSLSRLTAAGIALGVACDAPPATTEFGWSVAFAGAVIAIHAVCADHGAPVAVGGAAGQGAALEWTGVDWRAAELPAGTDLLWWCWMAPDESIVAVGERATVVRRGPTGEWTRDELAGAVAGDHDLYGVWGASADDLHAVGGRFDDGPGRASWIRWDGVAWEPLGAVLPDEVLFKVWGATANDVWAVGTGGAMVRLREREAEPYAAPSADRLVAVWGAASDKVYAVGGALTGVVHRFDGTRWTAFAETPEALAGVWTQAGRPLYVAGARGYLARFARGRGAPTVAVPLADVDYHALTADRDGAVLASGRDLLAGGRPSWRGAVLVHGGDYAGAIDLPVVADAGATDAGPDAAPLGPGRGAPCAAVPPRCAPGLVCWRLLDSEQSICTEPCDDARECAGYGAEPCCVRPGFQTLERVCVPGDFAECAEP